MSLNNHYAACPRCHEPVYSGAPGELILCAWCNRPTKGAVKALIVHYRGYNPPRHRTEARAQLAYAFRVSRAMKAARRVK